jgi:hypothetical protein
MAKNRFTLADFLGRVLVALLLVGATYNPSGYSWFHWFRDKPDKLDPVVIFVGIVLLIGWVIYLRATARSLGVLGIVLATVFFVTLIWLLVDFGWLSIDNPTFLQYIVIFALAAIMATGMSWSHIRRKLTGQLDVDDVDEG